MDANAAGEVGEVRARECGQYGANIMLARTACLLVARLEPHETGARGAGTCLGRGDVPCPHLLPRATGRRAVAEAAPLADNAVDGDGDALARGRIQGVAVDTAAALPVAAARVAVGHGGCSAAARAAQEGVVAAAHAACTITVAGLAVVR